jgi:hypothetical protein
LILSCVVPAAPLTAIIAYVDNETVRNMLIFVAAYAATACMFGLLATGLTAVPVLMPPVAFVVALSGFLGVHKIFRELTLLLLIGDAIVLIIVATGVFGLLKYFPAIYSRAAPLRPHWPRTLRHQLAIVLIPIGIVAAVGIGRLVYLDAAATQAAEQVRTYGYIMDRPYELNLTVRPVTVQLLTKDDPLQLCSAEQPVALTQLNQVPGDALVLMRYLKPGSLTPRSDRSPRTIRLPASQYAVVQHLTAGERNEPATSTPSDKPTWWTVSACSP